MEILQKNQMSYIFDELHHPVIKGKIGVTNHIKERLFERQRLSIKDFVPYFHNMKFQRGDRRCQHLRVIDQKIAKSTYPNCDYLYSKRLDMILVFDRDNKYIITVLDFDTSYYSGGYNISNY